MNNKIVNNVNKYNDFTASLKENREKKVYINSDFKIEHIYLLNLYFSYDYSEFLVYLLIKMYIDHYHCSNEKGIRVFLDENTLIFTMLDGKTLDSNKLKTIKKHFENGLKSLIKKEEITLIKTMENKKACELDVSNFYINTSNPPKCGYTIFDLNEVRKIIDISLSLGKYKLLQYSLKKLSTINKETKCGFISLQRISEGIADVSTCIEYDKILEENDIIYIYRSKVTNRYKDGAIKQNSNTYGRYEDAEIVEKIGMEHDEKNGFDETNILISSLKGYIRREYNNFCKGKKFKKYEIEELFKKCVAYNRDNKIKYNVSQGRQKPLNLTVFNDYIERDNDGRFVLDGYSIKKLNENWKLKHNIEDKEENDEEDNDFSSQGIMAPWEESIIKAQKDRYNRNKISYLEEKDDDYGYYEYDDDIPF